MKKLAILTALVALSATALANTITPYSVLAPSPGVWLYGATLNSGEIHAGDSFTIFDFGGYVPGSVFAPAGWSASATLTGSDPSAPPIGPDNPSEYNLRFTYGGVPIQQLGVTGLGMFGASTTQSTIAVDDWISQDHLIGNPTLVGDGSLGTLHRDQIPLKLDG